MHGDDADPRRYGVFAARVVIIQPTRRQVEAGREPEQTRREEFQQSFLSLRWLPFSALFFFFFFFFRVSDCSTADVAHYRCAGIRRHPVPFVLQDGISLRVISPKASRKKQRRPAEDRKRKSTSDGVHNPLPLSLPLSSSPGWMASHRRATRISQQANRVWMVEPAKKNMFDFPRMPPVKEECDTNS